MNHFSPDAGAKFAALVVRRNGVLDQPIDAYLRRSTPEPRDTHKEYALARVLRLADVGAVSVRHVWVNEVTTAYFILYGDEVVEVITHRGYTRTIQRKWEYESGAAVDGGRDGDRFAAAYKHKRPKQVGGGLMRGPASPRTKKLPIINTRTVRRMSDA